MSTRDFNNTEILHVIESISREKSIDPDDLFTALEDVIKTTVKSQYGASEINVQINKKTGNIRLYKTLHVVSNEEEYQNDCIPIDRARKINPSTQIGDDIEEEIPTLDVSRLSAYIAKGLVTTKLKEIEVNKQYESLRDKRGEIVHGIVKRINAKGTTVFVEGVECHISRSHMIKTDRYQPGDRIKAYLVKVEKLPQEVRVSLSRTHKLFLERLFYNEVPEMQSNLIEVKDIIRDPGSRSKIVVYSPDSGIDPIGSLIGVKGARVQAVTGELSGEKIDVIKWSPEFSQYIMNCFIPAQLNKLIVDEESNIVEIEVMDKDLSLVIGRRGQNVRLISGLIGMDINVTAESDSSKESGDNKDAILSEFIIGLDIDALLAQLLVSEGYKSVQEIADSDISMIAKIEGLDEAIAEELIIRAKDYLATVATENAKSTEESTSVQNEKHFVDYRKEQTAKKEHSRGKKHEYDELTATIIEIKQALHHAGVFDAKSIAEMSSDELHDLLKTYKISISKEKLNDIIMQLRKALFFSIATK